MPPPRSSVIAAALLAALPAAAPAAEPPAEPEAAPPALRLDLPVTAAITGATLAAALATVLARDELAPPGCRICGANGLDTSLRGALRWSDTAAASRASDVLGLGVPVLAAGALALSAWSAGGTATALEDLLVAGEAVSAAILATQVAKVSFGRLRPDAWAHPAAPRGADALMSLWSGHTAAAFAAATAAGTVARLRRYRAWPWILGLGVAGAAACGWLRVAADRHWATDVLAGAAAGSAAGLGLPVWLHAPREGGAPASGVALRLSPFGLAGTF